MQVLKSETYQRMPWKNGGGSTAQIAVYPPDAKLADFDWRISMATVLSDGPFSSFPGVDRTLTILSGAGMILEHDDQQTVMLTRKSAPYGFAADEPVSAVLVDGAVVDLNVMTRRNHIVHRVRRLKAPLSFTTEASVSALFCPAGSATITKNGSVGTLETWDCALLSPSSQPIKVSGCDELILIEFADVSAG
jgi:hypothetical protein